MKFNYKNMQLYIIFMLILIIMSMILLKVTPDRIISVTDYISIILALITVVGVSITFKSVKHIGEQVEIQKQQFELEKRPLFKVIYYETLDKNYVVIKEVTGNYFRLGDYMTRNATDGFAVTYLEEYSSVNGSERGLVFSVENAKNGNYTCNISLFVKDIFGKEYRYETPSFAIHENRFSELGHDLTGEFLEITEIAPIQLESHD